MDLRLIITSIALLGVTTNIFGGEISFDHKKINERETTFFNIHHKQMVQDVELSGDFSFRGSDQDKAHNLFFNAHRDFDDNDYYYFGFAGSESNTRLNIDRSKLGIGGGMKVFPNTNTSAKISYAQVLTEAGCYGSFRFSWKTEIDDFTMRLKYSAFKDEIKGSAGAEVLVVETPECGIVAGMRIEKHQRGDRDTRTALSYLKVKF